MDAKILIAPALACALVSCQSTDDAARVRLQAAATVGGQSAAKPPPIVLPAACTDHMEKVKLRDEPWVIFKFRWEVAAKNRDDQADDCRAWGDDLNRRNASVVSGAP
ncbi:hypothetical protein [Rhizobium sp. SAFR-030]|uniref:hypothetical protein n=1 Tax=Rhizobium sp. SAFR-030 TaxID=3387277 RepID=UPI003F811EF8